MQKKTDEERFWEKVKTGDGCWPWQGGCRGKGYGQCFFRGKPHAAHRVSWMLANGDIPNGLYVLHKCDNPPCVNPGHLFLGTQSENMIDCARKGRVATIGKARFTRCPRGHSFDEANTIFTPNGWRRCRICAE